jgi:hypothetical protein
MARRVAEDHEERHKQRGIQETDRWQEPEPEEDNSDESAVESPPSPPSRPINTDRLLLDVRELLGGERMAKKQRTTYSLLQHTIAAFARTSKEVPLLRQAAREGHAALARNAEEGVERKAKAEAKAQAAQDTKDMNDYVYLSFMVIYDGMAPPPIFSANTADRTRWARAIVCSVCDTQDSRVLDMLLDVSTVPDLRAFVTASPAFAYATVGSSLPIRQQDNTLTGRAKGLAIYVKCVRAMHQHVLTVNGQDYDSAPIYIEALELLYLGLESFTARFLPDEHSGAASTLMALAWDDAFGQAYGTYASAVALVISQFRTHFPTKPAVVEGRFAIDTDALNLSRWPAPDFTATLKLLQPGGEIKMAARAVMSAPPPPLKAAAALASAQAGATSRTGGSGQRTRGHRRGGGQRGNAYLTPQPPPHPSARAGSGGVFPHPPFPQASAPGRGGRKWCLLTAGDCTFESRKPGGCRDIHNADQEEHRQREKAATQAGHRA